MESFITTIIILAVIAVVILFLVKYFKGDKAIAADKTILGDKPIFGNKNDSLREFMSKSNAKIERKTSLPIRYTVELYSNNGECISSTPITMSNGSDYAFEIGADENCDLTIDDDCISRYHLKIGYDDKGLFGRDQSRNGTIMKGQTYHNTQFDIVLNEPIRIGGHYISFSVPKDNVISAEKMRAIIAGSETAINSQAENDVNIQTKNDISKRATKIIPTKSGNAKKYDFHHISRE